MTDRYERICKALSMSELNKAQEAAEEITDWVIRLLEDYGDAEMAFPVADFVRGSRDYDALLRTIQHAIDAATEPLRAERDALLAEIEALRAIDSKK